MTLQEYGSLLERLESVRADDAQQTAGRQQEAESGREELNQLVDRLTEQQAALHDAAQLLRVRMPVIDPAPSNALTAREALTLARAAADTSDREREHALARARQPRWLPDRSPVARNAAVYAACAGVGLVLQLILILLANRIDTTTAALWSLCGLPVIAFFVGYLLIGIVSVPRIPSQPAERDGRGKVVPPRKRMAPTPDRHPRLGAAICFLTLPVFWLLVTLLKQLAS